MTFYRHFIILTLTLLLTLLFTGCNSKTQQEESNTGTVHNPIEDGGSTTGTGETNTTVSSNEDNNTVTGANDDNTTTTNLTPTTTLASLNLSINKTSLNKGETITVKVMETYSDGSTNEVDTSIEYIITPPDSVGLNGAVLTAKTDGSVTVQAKVNNILSNTLNLTITWTVNEHTLPPEPDKIINDSTLLGIDVNDNGVRDDVERWIYEEYKDKHPIHIDIAMQAARGYKLVLETPERAKEIYWDATAYLDCKSYYSTYAKYFNEPILIKDDSGVGEYFRNKIYFNTLERKASYDQYDKLLSGDSYSLPKIEDLKSLCDFNTSKYED